MLMNKKSQIFNIFSVSVVFILSWFILGVMEYSSGFISEMLQLMITSTTGIDGASFAIKIIVPCFFIFSMIGFIFYIKGASSEI